MHGRRQIIVMSEIMPTFNMWTEIQVLKCTFTSGYGGNEDDNRKKLKGDGKIDVQREKVCESFGRFCAQGDFEKSSECGSCCILICKSVQCLGSELRKLFLCMVKNIFTPIYPLPIKWLLSTGSFKVFDPQILHNFSPTHYVFISIKKSLTIPICIKCAFLFCV